MSAVPKHRSARPKVAEAFHPLLNVLTRPFLNVPPNLVTLFALVLVLPMCVLFALDRILLGSVCFAVSMLADAFDGHIARAQDLALPKRWPGLNDIERARHLREYHEREKAKGPLFRLGATPFGTFFDPLVDKLRYAAAITPLAFIGLPWAWWISLIFIAAALCIAAMLTFVRIHAARKGISLPSNPHGKRKVWLECATVAALAGCASGVGIIWAVVALCLLFVAFLSLAAWRSRRRGWNRHVIVLAVVGAGCFYATVPVFFIGWAWTSAIVFAAATTLGAVSMITQFIAYDERRKA